MTHHLTKRQQKFAKLQKAWLEISGSCAKSEFIFLKPFNATIHTLEVGSGEPLVMLHGGNSFSALWEPLLNDLKNDFHLIAPDRFNCGLSDVLNHKKLDLIQYAFDYIDTLLAHYSLSSINVIGNSLGGYWAMLYALQRPERIKKIILIGAPGGTQKPPFILRLASVPFFNQILFFVLMNQPRSTEKLLERALIANLSKLPPTVIELLHAGLHLPGSQQAWLDILEKTCDLENIKPEFWLFDKLPQIKQPVLYISGDRDVFGSPAQAKIVADALPNCQLEIVTEAAHYPWLDQGETCAKLIKKFLSH